MNLIKDGHIHNHRGLIGVEATIIIIAVVLVAAVLAYVILNMGFSTSQKAKTTIGSTLTSASSNVEIVGKVIATSYRPPGGTASLNVTSFPIKIAPSGESVNLDQSITAIKYLSNQITYDNIYNGTLNALSQPTFINLQTATNAAGTYNVAVGGKLISQSPFQGGDLDTDDWPVETTAFIYWIVQSNTNDVLDVGEHANLVVVFAAGDRPEYLDKMRIELILASGASLTVERTVPAIYNEVVDLG
jgi:flagellin FlaB